jgi:hypothetical protein
MPVGQFVFAGNYVFAIIPAGSKNVKIGISNNLFDTINSLELFTTGGKHLSGDTVGSGTAWSFGGMNSTSDIQNIMLTEANGFVQGAVYDGSQLNGT